MAEMKAARSFFDQMANIPNAREQSVWLKAGWTKERNDSPVQGCDGVVGGEGFTNVAK